jgi:hypothetical protein
VARYAHAPLWKLLATCVIFAGMAALTVIFLLEKRWAPVITEAVSNLRTNSAISGGDLVWPRGEGRLLGANEFLSIEVLPSGDTGVGKATDLSIILRPRGILFSSLAGYTFVPYPSNANANLSSEFLVPAWGAWQPALLALAGAAVGFALLLSWALLSLLYAIIPLSLGSFLGREISWRSAWKLSYAALMPGALLISFGLFLSAAGQISLLFLILLGAAHWVVGWIYLLLAPFFLPKRERTERNPFEPKGAAKGARRGKNPFAG